MLRLPVMQPLPYDFGASVGARGIQLGLQMDQHFRGYDDRLAQDANAQRVEAAQARQFGYNARRQEQEDQLRLNQIEYERERQAWLDDLAYQEHLDQRRYTEARINNLGGGAEAGTGISGGSFPSYAAAQAAYPNAMIYGKPTPEGGFQVTNIQAKNYASGGSESGLSPAYQNYLGQRAQSGEPSAQSAPPPAAIPGTTLDASGYAGTLHTLGMGGPVEAMEPAPAPPRNQLQPPAEPTGPVFQRPSQLEGRSAQEIGQLRNQARELQTFWEMEMAQVPTAITEQDRMLQAQQLAVIKPQLARAKAQAELLDEVYKETQTAEKEAKAASEKTEPEAITDPKKAKMVLRYNQAVREGKDTVAIEEPDGTGKAEMVPVADARELLETMGYGAYLKNPFQDRGRDQVSSLNDSRAVATREERGLVTNGTLTPEAQRVPVPVSDPEAKQKEGAETKMGSLLNRFKRGAE